MLEILLRSTLGCLVVHFSGKGPARSTSSFSMRLQSVSEPAARSTWWLS
jgi:hypothetical protein